MPHLQRTFIFFVMIFLSILLTNYPANAKPELVGANYTAVTGDLELSFNEKISVQSIQTSQISIGIYPGVPLIHGDEASVLNKSNNSKITVRFHNPAGKRKLLQLGNDGTQLCVFMQEKSVENKDGETNSTIVNFLLAFISGEDWLSIEKASYDANYNKLYIYCDRSPAATYSFNNQQVQATDFPEIKIYDSSSEQIFALHGKSQVSVSGKILIINVLIKDQRFLETRENPNSLFMFFNNFTFQDEAGKGNLQVTLGDSLKLTYFKPDPTHSPVPEVEWATYSAITNKLHLGFKNLTALTSGIDAAATYVPALWINDHSTGEKADLQLSKAQITPIQNGEPRLCRELILELIPAEANLLESLPNQDSLELVIEPQCFYFEKTMNGNLLHRCPITYLTDSKYPEITSFWYDYQNDECTLRFSNDVLTDFDASLIKIYDIPLQGSYSGADIHRNEIKINVAPETASAIESLELAKQIYLKITIPTGVFQKADKMPNQAIDLMDGLLTSAGERISVGYGRLFWVNDLSMNPDSAYFQISASLRKSSAACSVFVANDQWYQMDKFQKGIIVNQIAVDSLWEAFHHTTPADSLTGIRQTCERLFSSSEETGNQPITILLNNIIDDFEYTWGISASSGYFVPGYDIPPLAWFYTFLNEGNILYLDTWPSISQGRLNKSLAEIYSKFLINQSPFKPTDWIKEGLAIVSAKICGYQPAPNLYSDTIPLFKPNTDFDLTEWSEESIYQIDRFYRQYQANTALFHLYLYTHFGGEAIIREIANFQDKNDTGNSRIEKVLQKLGYHQTFDQVFNDFAVACYFNQNNHLEYGNRFGFGDIEINSPNTLIFSSWQTPKKIESESGSAFKYASIRKNNLPDSLWFYSDFLKFGSKINFQLATMDEDNQFGLQEVVIESSQEPLILQDINKDVLFIVTSGADFTISNYPIIPPKKLVDLSAISGALQRIILKWSEPYLPDVNLKSGLTLETPKPDTSRAASAESFVIVKSLVLRSETPDGKFEKIAEVSDKNIYTDTPLETGDTLYYQIKAVLTDGDTAYSETISATTGNGICNILSAKSNRAWFGYNSEEFPSCEWPAGSGMNYLENGSIVFGARLEGKYRVSGNAYDEIRPTGHPRPIEENKILGISVFKDSVAYDDFPEDYDTLSPASDHFPLGIVVNEKTTCFPENMPQYSNFFLQEFTMTNAGDYEELSEFFVAWGYNFRFGMDRDRYYQNELVDYEPERQMSFMYADSTKEVPENEERFTGYIGLRLLKSPCDSVFAHQFRVQKDITEFTDDELYQLITGQHEYSKGYRIMPNPLEVGLYSNDYKVMLSTGPFNLKKGESLDLAIAIVIGEGLEGLQQNADYAKQLYDSLQTVSVQSNPAGEITDFRLWQNYPNPFNATTKIAYSMPHSGEVRLEIINILGQRVNLLVDQTQSAGQHQILWDGRNEAGFTVTSGIYFYVLKTRESVSIKKMILLK